MFKKRIDEVYGKNIDKEILIADEMSNFFDLESAGVWKVRGNGVLFLTEKNLFFGMWKLKKNLLILVTSIIEVTNPKSHMHRSIARFLLKITFRSENGEADSAAWYVRKLDNWNETLRSLLSRNRKHS